MKILRAMKDAWKELRNDEISDVLTPHETPHAVVPLKNAPLVKQPAIKHTVIYAPYVKMRKFLEENPTTGYHYVERRLATAIQHDLDEVMLFEFPDIGHAAKTTRENYETSLNAIIQHYIEIEEYERIPHCHQLLDRHRANLLMRSASMR